jgi:hypothetical protein
VIASALQSDPDGCRNKHGSLYKAGSKEDDTD